MFNLEPSQSEESRALPVDSRKLAVNL